jgi:hypothetical protein
MLQDRESPPWSWRMLHLPKGGSNVAEYEDAVAINAAQGSFAIADGASETSFAGLWARQLVEGFVQHCPKVRQLTEWLAHMQQRWASEVDSLSLPWYGEIKRDEGAFAAFLGLVLQQRAPGLGSWRAVAVGDCCLFQVRDDCLLLAFPLEDSQDFGSTPALLGSRPQAPLPEVQHYCDTWQTGDQFFLMTDALAQWFLRQVERQRRPWKKLVRLCAAEEPEQPWERWISRLRQRHVLRNDDVTLIQISL